MLISDNLEDIQAMFGGLRVEYEKVSLQLNFSKTKLMTNRDENRVIPANNIRIGKVDEYVYQS